MATVAMETYSTSGALLSTKTLTVPDPTPEQQNQATLQSRAQAALTANLNFVNQAKPGTASAQASQAYDAAVTLSKECTALIRLLLDLFDSTAGT